MVVYTYNPSTWRLRKEDFEFQANLGYKVRTCLRKERKKKNAGRAILVSGIRKKQISEYINYLWRLYNNNRIDLQM
jgi:hypothetical protein